MRTRDELVAAIDSFMAARKRVVRPNAQGAWMKGFAPDEFEMKWPLEVAGEQLPDAYLKVVGYPRERGSLVFRLMILCPAAVCRLDHTDENHANPAGPIDGVPPFVEGPHYHSWPINRRFFWASDHPVRLANAVPFDGAGRSFDAILRWFCDSNNIEPLPPEHLIELPRMERLL